MAIEQGTKVSIVVVGGVATAVFSFYQILSPVFEQVQITKAQVAIHQMVLKSQRSREQHIQDFHLEISDRISALEGCRYNNK